MNRKLSNDAQLCSVRRVTVNGAVAELGQTADPAAARRSTRFLSFLGTIKYKSNTIGRK